MPINATDTDTDTVTRDAKLNTAFNIYAINNSDPISVSNVHFVAPPNSKLHIDLDTAYHILPHKRTDGANRNTTDYGNYFAITNSDGDIIATGVINGLNFRTVSIGVVTDTE